jgi:hypothetical protein
MFFISDSAGAVEFEVSWDLDGIIEIYDSGTPDVYSDDKVLLCNRWWEHWIECIAEGRCRESTLID